MNFLEYCKDKNIDLTGINESCIETMAISWLNGAEPSDRVISCFREVSKNPEKKQEIIEKYRASVIKVAS